MARSKDVLRDFLKNRGGASAVEFAIITPILAGLLISGWDAWLEINRKQDMHAAVNAGAHYYMGGGTDDPTGQSISVSGWPNRPADGEISIARACTCAGGASSCTTVCAATQQAPEIRVTLTAQTQWNGLHPAALSEAETVRVR
jgi:Flp pilus assembly protein TadG